MDERDQDAATEDAEEVVPDLYDLYVRTEPLSRDDEIEEIKDIKNKLEKEVEKEKKSAYYAHISFFKACERISEEDNCSLAMAFQSTKNTEDRNRLVLGNFRLVSWFVKKSFFRMNFDDCVQWAAMGMLTSGGRWLPKFGTGFAHYSMIWMRQYVQRGHAETYSNIRVPAYVFTLENRIRKEQQTFIEAHGTLPSVDDLLPLVNSGKVQYYRNWVYRGLSCVNRPDISIEEMDLGGESENARCLNSEQILIAYEEIYETISQIKSRILSKLPFRQKRDVCIFRMRYGLDGTGKRKTLKDIGVLCRITREAVRRVEAKAWLIFKRRNMPENEVWLESQVRKIRRLEDLLGEDISASIFAADHRVEFEKTKAVRIRSFCG